LVLVYEQQQTNKKSWDYTFEEFVSKDLFRQPETSIDMVMKNSAVIIFPL